MTDQCHDFRPRVVHLISGGDTGGAKTHVLLLVSALGKEHPVQLVCLTPGEFYREARSMGLPVVLLEQKRRWDLSVITRLKRLLDDFNADILHCHGARANFVAALAGRRLQIPTLTTVHSDYLRDFEDNLYKHMVYTTLNTWSLRSFDYYIAVTEQFQQMLGNRGFSPDRIFTIYNGLDFRAAVNRVGSGFRTRWQIPDEHILIGTIGRLAGVKRHDIFLKAAATCLDDNPDLHFVIIGDGDEMGALQGLVSKLGIESSVTFTGHIDDVDGALAALDINVLVSESESFPYALLEGARHRLATVATPVGGIPELIRNGETGLTVPAGDGDELAAAVKRLANSPGMRERLGDNLKRHAQENFSLDVMLKSHTDIYSDIVNKHGSSVGKNIVISGYFGFGNTGDEALLEGMLHGLRKDMRGRASRITVLSADPRETEKAHGVRAVNRFSLPQVMGSLRGADLFLSGGGTLLQDETSLRSLMYYAFLIHAARLLRARVMIYANGLGPLKSSTGRYLARTCLKSADAVTLRDADSLDTANTLRVGKPMTVTADPAFCLQPAPVDEAQEILQNAGISRKARTCLISLRPWGDTTDSLVVTMGHVADMLHERGFSPVFYPMQKRLDLVVCRRASSLADCRAAVIEEELRPSLALALFQAADFAIGMRLHALILATAAGIPSLGLSYDPKIDGFLSEVGLPSAGRVEEMDYEIVASVLNDDVLPHLDTLKKRAERASARSRERAEMNAETALSLLSDDPTDQ